MNSPPSADSDQSLSEALARLEEVERGLERLAATVRAQTAELQGELGEVRLSVIALHSHAVSSPLAEAPVVDDLAEESAEGARLVALDLIGREISLDDSKERLREAFPGIDAERVLREVGATPAS